MAREDQSICYEERADIGVITLNRPQRLNTFRRQDYEQLLHCIQQARDSDIRCLLLTANGRAFSAGQDLAELERDKIVSVSEQIDMLDTLQNITRGLRGLDVPTLVAFNGFAVGVGLELSLACDIRIATKDSYFMFAEARRGLFPTNGVIWLLPRLIGLSNASAMLLLGRKFTADEGLQFGMLSEVVPSDHLEIRALEICEMLAENSAVTISGVKQLLRESFEISLDEMLAREHSFNQEIVQTPDFAEGVASFFEKRLPNFR